MPKILMPIPSRDFDPTEVAVTWSVLRQRGHEIVFATPDGAPGAADSIMLCGEGLDFWSLLPLLRHVKFVGLFLRADRAARDAYDRLTGSAEFNTPLAWQDIAVADYDGLVLAGGHRARGMRRYLESGILQEKVAGFFDDDKPVAAICHGVLLAARSRSARTGKSVLWGKVTTALTWKLERSATRLARFTRFWDPDYYRTYPDGSDHAEGYMSVESEVTRQLAKPSDFKTVAASDPLYFRKASGLFRDSDKDARPAFVIRDGNYVSARWPGDAHGFARCFDTVLREAGQARKPKGLPVSGP